MANFARIVVLNFKGKSLKEIENILTNFVSRSSPKFVCFPAIKFKNGKEILSIQASKFNYCNPRKDYDKTFKYTEVEIGFPNFFFSDKFIKKYAESDYKPMDTVYAYVPISEIAKEIFNIINS